MPMKNPTHPGLSVKANCLEPLGLSVTEAAKVLDVARHTLSRMLNGHAAISPEMAIRLSQGFGACPESWLKQQMQYDLWRASQRADKIEVKRFEAA